MMSSHASQDRSRQQTERLYNMLTPRETDAVWWYAAHMLAIAAHLVLLFAGLVTFPILAISDGSHVIRVTLAWGSVAVAQIGLVVNGIVFSALQKADEAVGHARYFRRQTTTVVAACAAMALVVGEIVMAKALARQRLGALCAIVASAATSTALSVIADIVKLYTIDAEDEEEDRLMWESQRIQI
ncbi:hypothetical protein F5B17DRAFT_393777 [Nemania serpens]|nr:hypothetical protein F5B17DRAFT_393777 [Nemania serpens]